jgi:hypothetical protein
MATFNKRNKTHQGRHHDHKWSEEETKTNHQFFFFFFEIFISFSLIIQRANENLKLNNITRVAIFDKAWAAWLLSLWTNDILQLGGSKTSHQ